MSSLNEPFFRIMTALRHFFTYIYNYLSLVAFQGQES